MSEARYSNLTSATITREALLTALDEIERAGERPLRPYTYTGEMAIASLYMQESLGAMNVLCGPKLAAEIRRLEGMTLAERIAERSATNE